MASPAPPIGSHQAQQPFPVFTDEILEEIFVRLPTPTDLALAATACRTFRRIIADRSFLRRFRAVHPPPLLGFATYYGFHPAEPPHPSAPLARALADVADADFSYSFVPRGEGGEPWRPCDVRQGRVLLQCVPTYYLDDAVYDDMPLNELEFAAKMRRRHHSG